MNVHYNHIVQKQVSTYSNHIQLVLMIDDHWFKYNALELDSSEGERSVFPDNYVFHHSPFTVAAALCTARSNNNHIQYLQYKVFIHL